MDMRFSKTKPLKELKILKEALVRARQEKGLTQEGLAKAVCLNKWQIKEMEESDLYLYFYSMQIKIHAARRIGNYLGLKEEQYLQENDECI
jgi:ribosome-binding protein aMBF1 (putative translation factor)